MTEEHFGKQLAKMMGIDLDELNASVEDSKTREIAERLHVRLADGEFYIKNKYENFRDTEIHYLKDSPQIRPSYNEKIASYIVLNGLKTEPFLERTIWDFMDHYDEYADEEFECDEDIKEFLFSNDYVESLDYGDGFWEYVYEINSYEDLKEYLDDEGIDSSGDKRDLIERIKELKPYDDFNEFTFKLSKKGDEYLESIGWIRFYLTYLDRFDFYEFEEYLAQSAGEFEKVSLDFLDEHINLALKRNDFEALFDAQSSKALCRVVFKDLPSALNEEVKLFIVRLNPTLEGDDVVFHEAVERVNINNIKTLIKLCSIDDLKGLFSSNWDLLDYEKKWFDEKSSFDIFTKALKSRNPDDLSNEVENRYFE